MRYSKLILAALAGALLGQPALAAPTAEEAAQLGKTLTPLGAIKAGNSDGTIPAWEGGLCTPPPGYKPTKGKLGGVPYVDPFANEKPLFRITAANLAKYADKLDDGEKEIFRRNPQTYFIDVYPSHRTACYPNYVYENTIKNVMKPKLVWGRGTPGLTDAHAQIPFPIPKSGFEAMWNVLLKYSPPDYSYDLDNFIVDTSGKLIHVSEWDCSSYSPYWDMKLASSGLPGSIAWANHSVQTFPPSQAGARNLTTTVLRQDLKDPPFWSYSPGQRRVRLSPELSYDTVSTSSGGILLFDEINGFFGKMDRFDFKLIGRKEMYMVYNTYKFNFTPVEKLAGARHANMEHKRYELHRMWVVEGTLKPGERHVEKKKTFYIDEDTWLVLSYDALDNSDKPYHHINFYTYPVYDQANLHTNFNTMGITDFNKGIFSFQNHQTTTGITAAKHPANYFTPDGMAGVGVR